MTYFTHTHTHTHTHTPMPGSFNEDTIHKVLEESVKMKSFDHPNVLSLIGVCVDAGPAPYIVMPYMSNGCLLTYLKKERRSLILSEGAEEEQVCPWIQPPCS